MCDIIHALYEEDSIPLYEDHLKIKSDIRSSMWRYLYDKSYPYPYQESATQNAGGLPPEESLLPDQSVPRVVKPYIPPTEPDKLAQILDAPMGG